MAEKEYDKTFRPKNDQELLTLLQKIGDMERGIEDIEGDILRKAREYIAYKDDQSLRIKELESKLETMVIGLETYARENKDRLIKMSGRKTIKMAGNKFGWQKFPVSVHFDDEDEAIKELVENGYADCVQIIRRVDRNMVKKEVNDFSSFKHLTSDAKEGFFIKPYEALKKISKVGKLFRRVLQNE